MPRFAFKRGITKVENIEDENNDTLEQNHAFLGVTSLKSITRPSNVSGMGSVVSPSSYHEPGGDYDDGGSNSSQSDFVKPSVHFGQFGQGDETVMSKTTSQHQTDVRSQKSFKTHDSKTIITVETAIKILNNPTRKKNSKGEKLSETAAKHPPDLKIRKSDTKTAKSKKLATTSQDTVAKAKLNPKKPSNVGGGTKSAVHTVKESHLISSRAQRDVRSDKGANSP